jgi:phosphatidylserine/phosphatidylglycerophosphate/cardiolipin synthase-like enzyme
MPGPEGGEVCNEIEHLWLEAMRAARDCIYIENQFLASGSAADVLEARLKEPDGPEVIIILPDTAESWLESEIMDSARARILARLHAADSHGRFAAFYPVNAAGEAIYVHAKLLIVDDRLVRIGSSNLSNRSMQLDSECDIAVEARGNPDVSLAIAGLRSQLVCEHLGLATVDFVRRLAAAKGSLVRTIEAARSDVGPTLIPVEIQDLTEAEAALVDSQIFNPERIRSPSRQFGGFAKRVGRTHGPRLGLALAGAAAATLLYRLVLRSRR